jgi:hypothetical protein
MTTYVRDLTKEELDRWEDGQGFPNDDEVGDSTLSPTSCGRGEEPPQFHDCAGQNLPMFGGDD